MKIENYNDVKNKLSSFENIKNINIDVLNEFINLLEFNKILAPQILLSKKNKIVIYWEFYNNYIEIEFNNKNYSYFIYDFNYFTGKDNININKLDKYLLSKLKEISNV